MAATPSSASSPGPAGSGGWRTSSRLRLLVMATVAVTAAVVTGATVSWAFAPLAGWDLAAASFCLWTWVSVRSMDAGETAAHATQEDPGRILTDVIVVTASVASLASIGLALVRGSSYGAGTKNLLAGLGVLSVALSWLTVHTLFTLRYARIYYRAEPGGIEFNQQDRPRYRDFAYLAFTIGMTYQVSDTAVGSARIRSQVLRHALLSYLFGSVILATMINLIAGLAASSSGN